RIAKQAPGQLGVEEPPRPEPEIGKAWQVLIGSVQDGLGVGQCLVEAGQIRAGDRVDQYGSGCLSAGLNQKSAMALPEAGGSLGVHSARAGPMAQPLG